MHGPAAKSRCPKYGVCICAVLDLLIVAAVVVVVSKRLRCYHHKQQQSVRVHRRTMTEHRSNDNR